MYKFIGANSLGYITGLNYILNVLPSRWYNYMQKKMVNAFTNPNSKHMHKK
jgi:hypothetical protein